MLGATLLQQGERTQAVAPLEAAHSLRPTHADAGKLLSIEYISQTRYRDAVEVLRRLVDAPPADQEIYLLIIEAYHRAGEADSSLRLAEVAVEVFPDSPRLNCWLGFQLGRTGRFDDAQAAVSKAIEIDSSYEPSFYVMGDILVEQGEHQAAIGYLQKAASMNPQDVETRVLLGRALAGVDRFTDALDELQRAVALNPTNADVHLEMTRVYLRVGDLVISREAADSFRETRQIAYTMGSHTPANLGFDGTPP
jgi:tetratricopeptide (TPR) repeat protein